jgi:aerobic-type carbon monoxide dehydrogenase small subunit (CoxS/CutS family)
MTPTTPPSRVISLRINGKSLRREVATDLKLIDFLHEDLGLTGTKFCCGLGVCQACTVLTRSAPTALPDTLLACVTPVSALDGQLIDTVEGVAGPNGLAAVQQAFLAHFAFQCGYCTPGFVMATVALLARLKAQPVPVAQLDEAIEAALGAHVCRCTGYARYHTAARELALQVLRG